VSPGPEGSAGLVDPSPPVRSKALGMTAPARRTGRTDRRPASSGGPPRPRGSARPARRPVSRPRARERRSRSVPSARGSASS
jgi:hypothetical protein